jgi:type VI secretion system protein VasG
MKFELSTLIERLTPICTAALERAAGLCMAQTFYNIEIEHLLLALLEKKESDFYVLFQYFGLPKEEIEKELRESQERFGRGNSRTPAFSRHLIDLLQESLLCVTIKLNEKNICSGAILYVLLENEQFYRMISGSSPTFANIQSEDIRQEIWTIIKKGKELGKAKSVAYPEKIDSNSLNPGTETPNLDRFTNNLTARAKSGEMDPIIGRETEIRQLIDILIRRRQNNPILTGDPGVGKTSVVEGLVLRIVEGKVPPSLRTCSVRALDLGLLQAGASIQGEFEKRLKAVISEVKNSSSPIILFIDEAHTLIGAGGSTGQGDAANLLKPALARGELMTIGATTHSEYKQYFEKDPALTRRFQEVKIKEPDEETAIQMLRGLKENMERHHQVEILDEAIEESVRLSSRYISGRQLPDKAISLLDTASARVAVSHSSTPMALENLERQLLLVSTEEKILAKEGSCGKDHKKRLSELKLKRKEIKKEKRILTSRWKKEVALLSQLKKAQSDLSEKPKRAGEKNPQKKAHTLNEKLETLQGETPMVHLRVNKRIVAEVVSGWTGIPTGKMLSVEIQTLLDLKEKMSERLIGQPHALRSIVKRVQTSRAFLDDPNRPVGVFLLAGPSGVGKTETAIALADLLYGGERNMITINMSEYQEAHTVSSLKGSPPGYVGYGKGGVLTEAVRKSPYSVILLDEVEKAHPDVMDLFYQVFDKGVMEDGEGITIDFKNTVILLTSNLGTETIMDYCQKKDNLPDPADLTKVVKDDLLRFFKPALIGRLIVIPYFPLFGDEIRQIVSLKLEKIKARILNNHQAELILGEDVEEYIAAHSLESEKGARSIDQMITRTMLPLLSVEVLKRLVKNEDYSKIHVTVDQKGAFKYRFLI